MTNVTSNSLHLISLTSDSVASITNFSLSSFNGPIMISENSQVTLNGLSVKKLLNKVVGMAIFDFSNSKVMLNNSLIQDVKVQMKNSNGAKII